MILVVKFIVASLSEGDENKIYTDLDEIKTLEFSGNVLQRDFVSNEYYKIKNKKKQHNVFGKAETTENDRKHVTVTGK